MVACRPWLIAEIDEVRPQLVICLGATAAQSLLGTAFRVSARRGELLPAPSALELRYGPQLLTTVQPLVLRDRTERRGETYRAFVDDLCVARRAVTGAGLVHPFDKSGGG